MHLPDVLSLDSYEVRQLLQVERDFLVTQVFLLLRVMAEPRSGELVTTYAQLIDLCTPPRPERGRPRPGPSLHQMRRVVGVLEQARLVTRDTGANQTAQLLRLVVRTGLER